MIGDNINLFTWACIGIGFRLGWFLVDMIVKLLTEIIDEISK